GAAEACIRRRSVGQLRAEIREEGIFVEALGAGSVSAEPGGSVRARRVESWVSVAGVGRCGNVRGGEFCGVFADRGSRTGSALRVSAADCFCGAALRAWDRHAVRAGSRCFARRTLERKEKPKGLS